MKPRVAMLAYACNPEGGGEHWLGWGWAEQAAGFCEVHLFAPPKYRDLVETHSARLGITPHFVEIPRWKRALSERLGSWGSWWRKIAWAKRAARQVAEVHRQLPIELVHQTTFHTFRVPFYAARLGLPSVWGPIAGGEHTPPGFDSLLGDAARGERTRAKINRRWMAWPSVGRSLRDADAIFVSNRTTLAGLPNGCRGKVTLVPPNTLRADVELPPRTERTVMERMSLLYVGNCVATRCIPLVLRTLAHPDLESCDLVVVGSGPAVERWRAEAQELGLGGRIQFTGQVERDQLTELYTAADVFVFPALRDAGGSGLLEAMSLGVPVVCLDWGGPGEMVDERSGIRIEVGTPAETIGRMRAALLRLQANPAERALLGRKGAERAKSHFTWEAKRHLLESTYSNLITESS